MTIGSWQDLERFGIDALTGEACGYAMRVLCDVTAQGKALIERFLGGSIVIKPESQWNGGTRVDPHVGSVLLPYSIFTDLAAFCLLQRAPADEYVVTMYNHGACTMDAERYAMYAQLDARRDADPAEVRNDNRDNRHITRVWRRSNQPGTGDRNTHMMSGRVE